MSTAAGRRLVDAVLRRSPAAGLSDCEIRGGPLDRQPGWDCRTPDRAVRVGERLVGRGGVAPGGGTHGGVVEELEPGGGAGGRGRRPV